MFTGEKKEGVGEAVQFKTCRLGHAVTTYLVYRSRLFLPNYRLFMNIAAGSWRRGFLFHCIIHYQQSLDNLC